MTTTTVYHEWERGTTPQGRPFLICPTCGARLTDKSPDWKAAFYAACLARTPDRSGVRATVIAPKEGR